MRGEQAIFNLEIKKKSGLSLNPDIHHSKVFSSAQPRFLREIFVSIKKSVCLAFNQTICKILKNGQNSRYSVVQDASFHNTPLLFMFFKLFFTE